MHRSRFRFPSLMVVAGLLSTSVFATESDVAILLDGVKLIASPGIPGNIAVFGEDAFAVVQDADGNVVTAAAKYGQGGVLLWGHNGYFGRESVKTADTGRLMVNAVRWTSRKEIPRVGVVGNTDLAMYLRDQGLETSSIEAEGFASVDVLIGGTERSSADLRSELTEWVKQGGAVIGSATGWGWCQLNPGQDLRIDCASNLFFAQMGLTFADGMTKDTAKDGYSTDPLPSTLTNASYALRALVQHIDNKQKLDDRKLALAGTTLSTAMRCVPPDDQLFLPKLQKVLETRQADPHPTATKPITNKNILERLVLTQQIHQSWRLPPEQVRAHPAAATFPGASPEGTPTVRRVIEIDTSVPGWHSTGLYADPGALITVTIPEAAVGKKLKVCLGSTTCKIWDKPKWDRAPEVTRDFALAQAKTRVANTFGGLIYLVVPDKCDLGTVSLILGGVVEAPYYILDKTDTDDWRKRIRRLPAPWAELTSSKAVLTVPSTEIRNLDSPESLMKTWDEILDLCADLAVQPRERDRPQRYSADVQLCAGWMHSGNPIMIPTVTAKHLVDRDRLVKEGDWGFYHETGHMHQHPDWTFGGTGEVTVNLFTMYVFDKLCGIAPEKGRMSQESIQKQYLAYFESGGGFSQWKSDPFLALYMYYQLQQAFGWNAYKKVFAEYHDLATGERPKNDDEKRDQWMVRFSRAVGKDLGPFFEGWGVPTSKAARESIKDLPKWLPEGFPPKSG